MGSLLTWVAALEGEARFIAVCVNANHLCTMASQCPGSPRPWHIRSSTTKQDVTYVAKSNRVVTIRTRAALRDIPALFSILSQASRVTFPSFA